MLRCGDVQTAKERAGKESIRPIAVATGGWPRSHPARGRPKVPADLGSHAIIEGPTGTEGWTFQKDRRRVSLRLEGRLVVSANQSAVAAAVAGLGIATTGIIAARKELANHTLVRVLPEWQMDVVDVHAVFPSGRRAKAAARALADHMAGAFRDWATISSKREFS